jgi:hypothetical protein
MLELRRLCSLTSEDECCSSDTQPLVLMDNDTTDRQNILA